MQRLLHLFVLMRPWTSSRMQLPYRYLYIVLPIVFVFSSYCCSADVKFHTCYTSTNYTSGSDYQTNLNEVLTTLSAITPPTGFNKTVAGLYPDQVYGLALCRVDISTTDCKTCVTSATTDSVSLCPESKEVRIWYDNCYMHYSNKAFFGSVDDTGWYSWSNTNVSDPEVFDTHRHSLMASLSAEAISDPSGLLFAMGYTNHASNKTIYGMVQCTRDVSATDCNTCLAGLVDKLPSRCGSGINGRIMHGTCGIRYDITAFFVPLPPPPPPSSPPSTTPSVQPVGHHDNGKHKQLVIILAITIPIVVLVSLYAWVSYAFIVRRTARREPIPSKESLQTAELKILSFDAIRVATDNFSEKNKLGQGGYGHVYKGILNGEAIAVKRLALESSQGVGEFMNEVQLVAKLRHRNLVRLLGCCSEGNEKILIYEYMPNASLDKFLFDPIRCTMLDWQIRLKIIIGIARALVYLHEDSPVRIIHRDLKASNVLLDKDMSPKIADFGLARNFDGDQTRGNTNLIGGTQGYMAPEYVLQGQFSTRSDVYSFGVLLLELVSGQKNAPGKTNLLEIAWRNWREERALELMDPSLSMSCQISNYEVMRCIHMGLLCIQDEAQDRPAMSNVVAMLTNHSVPLPSPTPSTFFTSRGSVDYENEASTSNGSYGYGMHTDLGGR